MISPARAEGLGVSTGGTQLVTNGSTYRPGRPKAEPQGPDTQGLASHPQAALAPPSTGPLPQGHEAVGELKLRGHQLTADGGDWRCPHHRQVRPGLRGVSEVTASWPRLEPDGWHAPWSPLHLVGSRATHVRWQEMTSTCLSSSARRASPTCWRHCLHRRPQASAPAGELGQSAHRGLWRAGQCWADAFLRAD